MPLSNSFVKRVGKEDRYRKGWHPLIIGGLTILLFIFRAYQISDTPFLLLYHCSLNLDSLHQLRHFVHENLFSTPKSEIFGIKISFLLQNLRFSALKSFFCMKIRESVHQKLFCYSKSEILCIKIFFLHENLRFCASKSFFCMKIRDSVHQNLFSARKSEILCIKIFFLHENPRFCASKSFFCTKIRDFRYQNLFCLPNCGMERDTKRKRRMYHQES